MARTTHQKHEQAGSDWLTLPEAARHFAVSTHTIRRWIREGKLPAEKRPGRFGEQLFVPTGIVTGRQSDPMLVAAPLHPHDDGSRPSQLVGRDAELAILRSLLQAASDGKGCLVLIGGEAGIGKTTIAQRVIDDAVLKDFRVLIGRCYDLEATPPYGPWIETIRSYRLDGTQPAPPVGLATREDLNGLASSWELYDQVWTFLAGLTERHPVLLVLEDMHWADQPSLELLRHGARHLENVSLLILLTYRDVELTPDQPLYRFLPHLIREATAERIHLRRLDCEAIEELLAGRYDLAPADRTRLVDFLSRYAEGNPLFVDELLHAIEIDQILCTGETGWRLGELAEFQVPLLIRQIIDSHLERLEPAARELLQVAAVIGEEIPIDLWQVVSGSADDTLAQVIEQAIDAQILVEATDRPVVRFRHALIREALYKRMILLRRRSWHRRVAEVLIEHGNDDPDIVAHHLMIAGDPRAADWLIRAGRLAAETFAFQITMARLEKALEILRHDEARLVERGRLLCELAEAHLYTAADHALEMLDEARQLADRLDDQVLRSVVMLCRARVQTFRGERALPELREAFAILDWLPEDTRDRLASPALRYATSRATYAQSLAQYGCYHEAMMEAERFLASQAPADPREYGNAYFAIGLACSALGFPNEARVAFATARDYFRKTGTRHLIGATFNWEADLVMQVYFSEDPAERWRLIEEGADALRHSVFGSVVDSQHYPSIVDALLLDGRWAEARASATALVSTNAQRFRSMRILADLDRLQGNRAAAWSHIATVFPEGPESKPTRTFFPNIAAMPRIAAELALEEEDQEWARRWIEALERWLDWSDTVAGRGIPEILWARYHELRGELEQSWKHAERALTLAQDPRQPLVILVANRMLGHLASRMGQNNVARHHLEAALALADACAAPYERALTLFEKAGLLADIGLADEARECLVEVRLIATKLDARPLLERVAMLEQSLEVAGVHLVRVFSDEAVPGGLSPREVEVLQLVAQGLTDAEIGGRLYISPRTVSGHLQSIYNKLGISSRTAATAFAYEHDLF